MSRLVPLLRSPSSHTVGVGNVLPRQAMGDSVVELACKGPVFSQQWSISVVVVLLHCLVQGRRAATSSQSQLPRPTLPALRKHCQTFWLNL